MIDGFSKIGDIATARGFFDRLPLELKYVVTWTVMVGAYTSNGETEEAKKVFEEMEQRNCFVWSSMICGYFKNGYCEEALEAFFKMQTEGFEPIEVTIVRVLSVCAQLGVR